MRLNAYFFPNNATEKDLFMNNMSFEIREILFNSNIDWNKALKIAKKNMPEINSLF